MTTPFDPRTAQDAEQEIARISNLPVPQIHPKEVMEWRRRRLDYLFWIVRKLKQRQTQQ